MSKSPGRQKWPDHKVQEEPPDRGRSDISLAEDLDRDTFLAALWAHGLICTPHV
jgi:hypothetical protein